MGSTAEEQCSDADRLLDSDDLKHEQDRSDECAIALVFIFVIALLFFVVWADVQTFS